MPDRLLRDELLESDRWLDLHTDTHRLTFIGLVLKADDFGNIEGGPRRMFRFLRDFTQCKTESDSIKLLSDLQDFDLIRRYEIDGREFWHLPRFKSHRQYLSMKVPLSPWNEENPRLGKDQRIVKQGLAKNVATTSLPRSRHVAEGVGVGEGVGKELKPLCDDSHFDDFWAIYPNKKAKKTAKRVWDRLSPKDELRQRIFAALETQKKSPDWQKENGRYVPLPATYLNGERWKDEVTTTERKLVI